MLDPMTRICLLLLMITSSRATFLRSGCKANDFQCTDGTCISFYSVCDGKDDCSDDSDEDLCGTKNHGTSARYFICNDGVRVNLDHRCDGQTQCGDGSDELNCPSNTCVAVNYMCDNNKCIEGHRVDDKEALCSDNSDVTFHQKLQQTDKYSAYSFQCADDKSLVDGFSRCHGNKDCKDGSDEDHCRRRKCASNEFQCGKDKKDRKCIPYSEVCNGKNDCSDGMDELNCSPKCPENEFMCGNGQCMKKSVVCDGVRQCIDGSDEWNCNMQQKCPPCHFQCGNGRCVHETKRCNGLLECGDGSDEWKCSNFTLPDLCSLSLEAQGILDISHKQINLEQQAQKNNDRLKKNKKKLKQILKKVDKVMTKFDSSKDDEIFRTIQDLVKDNEMNKNKTTQILMKLEQMNSLLVACQMKNGQILNEEEIKARN